jgi:hypothetical protein
MGTSKNSAEWRGEGFFRRAGRQVLLIPVGIGGFCQRGALPHSYAHYVRYAVRFANRLKPGQKGNDAWRGNNRHGAGSEFLEVPS